MVYIGYLQSEDRVLLMASGFGSSRECRWPRGTQTPLWLPGLCLYSEVVSCSASLSCESLLGTQGKHDTMPLSKHSKQNKQSKVFLNGHSGGDILIWSYGSEGAIVFCSLEDQKTCQTPRTQKPYRLLKLQMTWRVLKNIVTGLRAFPKHSGVLSSFYSHWKQQEFHLHSRQRFLQIVIKTIHSSFNLLDQHSEHWACTNKSFSDWSFFMHMERTEF